MTSTINKVMGPMEWVLLIILSVLWGGSFFFSEVALAELPPLTVVLGRVGFAAIALNILVIAMGHRMPTDGKLWRDFLIMGALNNLLPFSLIVWGQTQITSGLAAILNATTPLWTVLLAHFLTTNEKMTPHRLGGVLLGLVGVTLIIGPEALSGLGINFLAQAAIVGAAIAYAFAGLFGKRFREVPSIVTATGQITSTTMLMIPLVLFIDQPWTLTSPSFTIWASILGLALLSTTIAYIIYFRLLASAGATNLLLVTFLIPISALLLGMTILGERLETIHFGGMIFISLGLIAVDGRLLQVFKRK